MAIPPKVIVSIAIALSATALTAFQTQQQKKKLREAEKKARNRIDVMLRSATEAQRIIYGQRRVSGVLTYANVRLSTGTADNSDLWQVIALAGHEVNAITDLYLDGDKIPAASINGSGEVTGGKYAPISGRPTVQILKNLGSDTQSALSIGFADWTSNHRLRGVAHIATRFELSTRGSGGLWKNGAPSNVRVTVQGKKVYDPRLDSTAGGSGSHRLADPSTWEYSANPALCLADYLIDTRLGMGQEGITSDDIDYGMVATAADECDVTVSVPGGTEARYEINGVLFSTDSYEKNILDILSCMNGTMVWSNGQFRIRAGEYEAPVESFDEDDIIGSVSISAERGREERINKIRGTYASADQNYDLTQYIPVEDANLIANRDNGNELVETIDQPLVTSEYQAQRLAFKLIQINNQQLRATIPLNYRAMNVRVGDRIQVSVDALNWSNKVFRVEGWKFGVEDGFVLSVIEDSSTAYDDPDVGDYSTRSASGVITFADPPVPSPSNLTVTSQRNGILVEWDEPEPPVLYDEVQVFASPDSSWSNAVLVASTRGTTFFHDLDPGTERYYWARAIDNKDELSDREPDSDTSSVVATAGAVGARDVDGLTSGNNIAPPSLAAEQCWTTTFGPTFLFYLSDYGLEPGDVISASIETKHDSAGTGQLIVEIRNSSDVTIAGGGGSGVKSIGTSYQLETVENVVLPATAHQVRVYMNVVNNGGTYCQRRMMVHRGEVALPFERTSEPNAPRLGLRKGYQSFTTTAADRLYIHGFDKLGNPADVDGQISYQGGVYTVPKGQIDTTKANQGGWIVFETSGATPFTMDSPARSTPWAFAWKDRGSWYYDQGFGVTTFTPTDTMVIIGTVQTGVSADTLRYATAFSEPIALDVVGEPGATINEGDFPGAVYRTTSSTSISTSGDVIEHFTEDRNDGTTGGLTFNGSTDEWTFGTAGSYKIRASLPFESEDAAGMVNAWIEFKDGAAAFAEVAGSRGRFPTPINEQATVVCTATLSVSALDRMRLVMQKENASATVQAEINAVVQIERARLNP